MRDCFVVTTTSQRRRGDRIKMWERCAQLFNTNVRPVHPGVPLLIFSEGEDDLLPADRDKLSGMLAGPVEFRHVSLHPPQDMELPRSREWHHIENYGVTYRGMCWFYIWKIGQLLKDEFDYICRFDDDSHFLSTIEKNFFDRMRKEDCWYAYRGTCQGTDEHCVDMAELLEYNGIRNLGVPGLGPQSTFKNTIFTNFAVFRRDLYDHELYRDYLLRDGVQDHVWTHRWGDGAVQTALLSRAPLGFVRLWSDFKYGHAPLDSPRYHMALDATGTFWQPSRWPANKDGMITNKRAYKIRHKRHKGSAGNQAQPNKKVKPKTTIVLAEEQRNKAVVVIGDGLGNVIAQTPMLQAVISMFKEVHVWLPRSRPDIPDIIRDLPNVVTANKEWIDAMDGPDAIFQTWLVAPQANAKRFKSLLARYEAKHPRGTGRNEVSVCMDAVRKAGYKDTTPHPRFSVDCWPDQDLCHKAPLIGFTTGRLHRPMWRFKEYPAASYAKVVDIVKAKIPAATFVQVGWKKDTKIDHPDIVDTRHSGTLKQSLGLVNACTVFCGNDTGLCWAASAMLVPTVVVFGPTDPVKCLPPWGAVKVMEGLRCQPCQWRGMGKLPDRKTECKRECMLQLSPSDVASTIIREYEIASVKPK